MSEPLTHTEATFQLTANAPMDEVAPLFGAERERLWAPDWNPRFLHPAVAADVSGMVFTVSRGDAELIWVNTQLDLARGVVQYVYVIPETLTTVITLHLLADGERTHVEVTYARTALRPDANARVAELAAADRASGPEWEHQINGYLQNR